MSGIPAAAINVGTTSSSEKIPLSTWPEGIFPGQRITKGTRKPPSHPRPFSPRNWGRPAVRPAEFLRSVVCGEEDDRIVGNSERGQCFEQLTDDPIELSHPISVDAEPRLAAPALREPRPHVH